MVLYSVRESNSFLVNRTFPFKQVWIFVSRFYIRFEAHFTLYWSRDVQVVIWILKPKADHNMFLSFLPKD